MKQYDAIIIGFGKGGKTLTAELAKRGWKVALIERSAMMYGGTCPNIACVPTKRLIHEAEKVSWLYPTDYEKQAEAYKAAIARKNEMTAASRANMFNKLSSLPNVTIYTGMASFVSKDVVKVTLPDEVIELQGKKIFINTGIRYITVFAGNKLIASFEYGHFTAEACVHRGKLQADVAAAHNDQMAWQYVQFHQ